MEPVAGKLNEPRGMPIDRIHRAYRERCCDFAEAFGYDENYIATYFEEFALMRVFEQGMHKNLAAFVAWQDVQACFCKQAETGD